MKKRQIFIDFLDHAAPFVAAIIFGPLLALFFEFFCTDIFGYMPHVLAPHNSGLSDNIGYIMTIGVIFGLLVYIAYLAYLVVKNTSRTALFWICAALIEIGALYISLLDNSLGNPPYTVSSCTASWTQLIVMVLIITGYFIVFRSSSK